MTAQTIHRGRGKYLVKESPPLIREVVGLKAELQRREKERADEAQATFTSGETE